jgi:hypothetical protein
MNNKNCTKTKSGKLSRHYSAYKNNRRQYRFLRAQQSRLIRLGNEWPDSTQKFFNETLYFGRKQEMLRTYLWFANTANDFLVTP